MKESIFGEIFNTVVEQKSIFFLVLAITMVVASYFAFLGEKSFESETTIMLAKDENNFLAPPEEIKTLVLSSTILDEASVTAFGEKGKINKRDVTTKVVVEPLLIRKDFATPFVIIRAKSSPPEKSIQISFSIAKALVDYSNKALKEKNLAEKNIFNEPLKNVEKEIENKKKNISVLEQGYLKVKSFLNEIEEAITKDQTALNKQSNYENEIKLLEIKRQYETDLISEKEKLANLEMEKATKEAMATYIESSSTEAKIISDTTIPEKSGPSSPFVLTMGFCIGIILSIIAAIVRKNFFNG
jgi:uncharacterized protein involved in exopolysaccharide biosynthesis